MPPDRETGDCKCNFLEREANNPKSPISFDARLNEYHITRGREDSYSMIYYCPFCGGAAPKSKRSSLFHTLTSEEAVRLSELTKDLKTVQEVIEAFGEPDLRQAVGVVVTTPEREGQPETTRSYPEMIYKKLSEVADVYVTIYPNDKLGFAFQGKSRKEA